MKGIDQKREICLIKNKNSKKIAKMIKALMNCADIKIKFTNNHDVIN